MLSKLVLLAIIFSAQVMAGDRVGNGGDVVVCANNTIEMLDAYEAEFNGSERMVFEGKDYQSMVGKIIKSKLEKIQPRRAKRYLEHLANFSKEALFAPGIKLDDIDDAGMVTLPVNCHLEQVAIQLSNSELPPGRKRYTINLDLWKRLDEENKAILVLHEIVYREAFENKSSHSMFVRAMVEQLIKKKMSLITLLELDFRMTSTIEFKLAKVLKGSNPLRALKVSLEGDLLKIESPSYDIQFNYCENIFESCESEIKQGGEFLSLHVSSGEVASFKRYGTEQIVMIPANQTIDIETFDQRAVKVKSDKNIKYIAGWFFGGNSKYSLEILQLFSNQVTKIIAFSKVTKLGRLSDSGFSYYYKGNFSVSYDKLIIQNAKEVILRLGSYNGSVMNYSMKEGTVVSVP